MTSATPKPLSLLLPNIVPEQMYSLEGEKLRFFKTATGIDDEDKLREHMLAIQREAFKVMNSVAEVVVNLSSLK